MVPAAIPADARWLRLARRRRLANAAKEMEVGRANAVALACFIRDGVVWRVAIRSRDSIAGGDPGCRCPIAKWRSTPYRTGAWSICGHQLGCASDESAWYDL